MAFGELTEVYKPGLQLRVKGNVYDMPLPSAALGLWCRALSEAMGLAKTASAEQMQQAVAKIERLPEPPDQLSFQEWVLGSVYGQMMADGVEHPYIQFCAFTAFIWIAVGEEAAQVWWESGGDLPEAQGPGNRAQRRAADRTPGKPTVEASATLIPASTSGTSHPRPRRRRRPARR